MSASSNALIPSYVDIEAELRRQRELVAELKTELNIVTNQRDEVQSLRDAMRERVDEHIREIERLRRVNASISRQNSRLKELERHRKGKGNRGKKVHSKVPSITNRKGHRRSSVRAKHQFRKR